MEGFEALNGLDVVDVFLGIVALDVTAVDVIPLGFLVVAFGFADCGRE